MKSTHPGFRLHFNWLVLVLVSAMGINNVWASAGRFQFIYGDIRIVGTDGRERLARKGVEIYEGESIVSAKGASAQLRMSDGGIVAVRQDTNLRIEEYKFNGKEDGSERGFFSLIKGGFRSITGLIGKLHRQNYRIRTPAATIGIRGTDSETIHLLSGDELPPDMQPGTYNKVNTGATVVNGTVVGPNQVAYTPSLDIPATILPKMPSLFEPPKAAQGSQRENQKREKKAADKDTAKNGDSESSQPANEQAPDGKTNTDSQIQTASAGTTDSATTPADGAASLSSPPNGLVAVANIALLPPPPPPTTPIVNTTTTTGGLVGGSNLVNAPIGYGGVGGDISSRTEIINAQPVAGLFAGNGSIVVEGPDQLIVIDTKTKLPATIAEKNPNGNSMQYLSGTAQFVDGGMRSVGGATAAWGRYVGADQFADNQGVRDPITMNLMFTNQAMSFIQAANYYSTAPATNYSLTVPFAGNILDHAGKVYTPTSGTFSIAAGATASGVFLNLAAGSSWNLSYGGNLSQFYGACTALGPCGLPLTTWSGSLFTGATVVKGNAAGVLVGPSAGGALVSFSANSDNSKSLIGTALMVAPGF